MSMFTAVAWEMTAESRIEAFESAWQHDAAAVKLENFLPPAEDPCFLAMLCELVRVDIELRWTNRAPKALDDYLDQFPELNHSAEALQQIAFEEYRQRLQSGERVAPCEYEDRFGIDISRWPAPAPPIVDEALAAPKTCALPNKELEQAFPRRTDVAGAIASSPRTPFPRDGETFAGFRIVCELGSGAFGRVYLAEQLDLASRRVALKVSQELNGESQKLAQLQHTNIMPIYSAHQVGSLHALCMPYYGATTLAQVIQGLRTTTGHMPKSGRIFLSTLFAHSHSRRGSSSAAVPEGSTLHGAAALTIRSTAVPEDVVPSGAVEDLEKLAKMTHVDAALWIIARVADGLEHAHSRNIMHRDLKPANILLTDEGQPMLLDFNLATSRNAQALNRYRNGGTLPYMAPEQLAALVAGGCAPDPRSDLYSLGVILFELLTGRHPFRLPKGKVNDIAPGMVQDRITARIKPQRFNPLVTPAVAAIVRKLLAANVDERYQSAAHLQEDLDRHLDHLPLKHAREASLRERVEKFRRRHPRLWTGTLVTLATSLLVILPLALQTAKQFEMADRRRQTQRAEAVVLLNDTQRKALAAQLDLYARAESSRVRQRGMQRVEEIVSRYAIDAEGSWLQTPEVTRLNDVERSSLLSTLGQTMWIMAESCRQQAADSRDPRAHEDSDHWQLLARQCFDRAGRTPMALRAGGKPVELHAQQDLGGLDDADLYSLASDVVTVGRYRDGLRFLKELTGRDPAHFLGWFMRGLCHEGLGQDGAAAEAWTVCIALQPDFAKAYYNRAIIRIRQKDYVAAHADFGRALERDSANTYALVNKGLTSLWLEQYARAEQELTAAIEQENPPSRVYFLRAKARYKLGKPALAKADEVKGQATEPTDDIGWATRGWALLDTDPTAALQDFERALAINPRNRDALNNRVHVLYTRLNRYDDALHAVNHMLEYYPDHLGARASRGVVYARLGKIEQARADADYCLANDQSAFSLYQIGSLYAQIAKHDPSAKTKALSLLGQSLEKGLVQKEYFTSDKDLDPLRDDAKFTELVDLAQTLQAKKVNAK